MRTRKITRKMVRQYVPSFRGFSYQAVEDYWGISGNTHPRRADPEGARFVRIIRELAFREMMRRRRIARRLSPDEQFDLLTEWVISGKL